MNNRHVVLDEPPSRDLTNMRGVTVGGLRGLRIALKAWVLRTSNCLDDNLPGMREIRRDLIQTVAADVLGLPKETEGVIRPSGSIANEDALYLSRQVSGRNRIVTSNLSHASIRHAAERLGMSVTTIPVDPHDSFQMPVEALLDSLDDDVATLQLTAGTTQLGTIDRLDPRVEQKCEALEIGIHVDAAYGGFAMGMLPDRYPQARALRQLVSSRLVDSITIDPHKFAGPMDCSILLFPHGAPELPEDEQRYFDGVHPRYGTTRGALVPFLTLETMRMLGKAKMQELAEQTIKSARYLEQVLANRHVTTITPVQTGVVPVRLHSRHDARRVFEELRRPRPWGRLAVPNPFTIGHNSTSVHGVRLVLTPDVYWDICSLEDLARVIGHTVKRHGSDGRSN